jgi:hypothetical protein
MIVLGGPGVRSFSESPIIFAVCIKGFTCRLVGRISLLTGCDAMFAYEIFLRNCSLPIALVYTSFLSGSTFLALNIAMNWLYQGNEITSLPEDVVGFVYQITNTVNGRMYIGKKLARFKRSRPPLKGRKNKRRYKVDSDWQDYYGSSDELSADVLKLGKEKFTREILIYCFSKAELSYVEAREQFARKVLESDDYYNGHIRVRVHGKAILKK